MKIYKKCKAFPSLFKISISQSYHKSSIYNITKSENSMAFYSCIENYRQYSISKIIPAHCEYTHSNTRLFEIKNEI